jgi:hypothetical protein
MMPAGLDISAFSCAWRRAMVLACTLMLPGLGPVGCGPSHGEEGGSGTEGGSSGGVSASSTTIEYGADSSECVFACEDAEDCCVGNHPPEVEGAECPGESYPNNWICVLPAERCAQFEDGSPVVFGCRSDADCVADITGYACRPVDTVYHCVELCEQDEDCRDFGQPNPANQMFCTGTADGAGGSYCLPTAPP